MKVASPKTKREFERYYHFRWQILRAPWNQPSGSERDELDDTAYHVVVWERDGVPIGVGRLHFNNKDGAQIRYMAVEESFRGNGIGTAIHKILKKEGIKKMPVISC